MRKILVALLALGLLVLVAVFVERSYWLRPSPERPVIGMKTAASDVTLTCGAKVEAEVLRLTFAVTNSASEVIYVFDHGVQPADTDLVCDAGDATIHVVVGVPRMPPKTTAYWLYHPKTTKLTPGEARQRELVLPLPLREMSPYAAVRYDDQVTVEVSRLRLRLDFVRASKANLQHPDEPRGKTPADIEAAVCEVVLPHSVDLLRRTDDFFRE